MSVPNVVLFFSRSAIASYLDALAHSCVPSARSPFPSLSHSLSVAQARRWFLCLLYPLPSLWFPIFSSADIAVDKEMGTKRPACLAFVYLFFFLSKTVCPIRFSSFVFLRFVRCQQNENISILRSVAAFHIILLCCHLKNGAVFRRRGHNRHEKNRALATCYFLISKIFFVGMDFN